MDVEIQRHRCGVGAAVLIVACGAAVFLVPATLNASAELSGSRKELFEQARDPVSRASDAPVLDQRANPKAQTASRNPDGQWTLVDSPNVFGGWYYQFGGVRCLSSSECWAVGHYHFGETFIQSLIQRWDGSSWSIVNSNGDPSEGNYLFGVDCPGIADCWAVGGQWENDADGGVRALVKHWNGTLWVNVAAPDSPPGIPASGDGTVYAKFGNLHDVHCNSASDCWAVGTFHNGGDTRTLVQHWNGLAWSIVDSPNASSGEGAGNSLRNVSCVSAADCWAAGYSNTPAGAYRPLMLRWNGTAWTFFPMPAGTDSAGVAKDTTLSGMTCVAAADCWAVGSYYRSGRVLSDGTEPDLVESLIQHWDGQSWSIVESPPMATTTEYYALGSVTCVSASDCWAVGTMKKGSAFYQNLAEHWNGSRWTVVPTPNAPNAVGGSRHNLISGITCVTAGDCWAVGHQGANTQTDAATLILHYTATETVNAPPIADAGADFAVTEGQTAQWTGSAIDPDSGDTLSYAWQQIMSPGDPTVSLAGADSPTASFSAPAVDQDTSLVFQLTVSDSAGAQGVDRIAVTVQPAPPPPDSSPSPPPDPPPSPPPDSPPVADVGPAPMLDRNNHIGGGALPLISILLLGCLGGLKRRRPTIPSKERRIF